MNFILMVRNTMLIGLLSPPPSCFSGPNSVFRHVITFEHVSGAMMTFETVDSDDIRQLIHSMTNGILQRSTFAVATQNFRGIVSKLLFGKSNEQTEHVWLNRSVRRLY